MTSVVDLTLDALLDFWRGKLMTSPTGTLAAMKVATLPTWSASSRC